MPRQEKETTKAHIQQATIRLFAKKGYRDISMEDIAAGANITKRTLYKYYPSKLALFISIFEINLQMFLDSELETHYAGLSYADTLRKMFTRLHEFTKDNQGFMRLFWMLNSDTVEGEVPTELIWHINSLNERIIELTARCLEGKQTDGMLGKYHPVLVTHMFSAMNKGLYMQVDKEKRLGVEGLDENSLFELFCDLLTSCS
jgi:AcrR family transcriptional regulator